MWYEVLQHDGQEHVVLLGVGGAPRRDDEAGEIDGEEAEVADEEGLDVGPSDVHLGQGEELGHRAQLLDLGPPDGVHRRRLVGRALLHRVQQHLLLVAHLLGLAQDHSQARAELFHVAQLKQLQKKKRYAWVKAEIASKPFRNLGFFVCLI